MPLFDFPPSLYQILAWRSEIMVDLCQWRPEFLQRSKSAAENIEWGQSELPFKDCRRPSPKNGVRVVAQQCFAGTISASASCGNFAKKMRSATSCGTDSPTRQRLIHVSDSLARRWKSRPCSSPHISSFLELNSAKWGESDETFFERISRRGTDTETVHV